MTDIIKKITDLAPYLAENDLDEWVVPELHTFYTQRIASLAIRAYGQAARGSSTVAHLAFKERAKSELRSAVNTFIFKSEHWKNGRDLNSYILTCLNRLADRIHWDNESAKKVNMPICPGCKHLGQKEYLNSESRMWRCLTCSNEAERLPQEIKKLQNKINKLKNDNELIINYETRLRLHRVFAIHSRKGYRCPDCNRFIPESANGSYGISCPYDDCMYFGEILNLERMAHPVGLSQRNNISLKDSNHSSEWKNGNKFEILNNFEAENINPDVQLEVQENFATELQTLVQVIQDQLDAVKRTNSAGTMMQKLLMYEAYQRMLEKCPEEMVSYLVHRKQNTEFPIQARIFQEYAKLMEEAIPYDIVRGNDVYHVVSLTDPNIQLFSGISEFDAIIQSDHSIPNNTVETYTGGLKFKDYGPCFIGMLIDIIDKKTNKSIKDKVLNHTFVQINMKPEADIGTPVLVKHFRIPSHYELGALVYLQRVRRKIVDSIHYRLYGEKRVIERSNG